MGIVVNLSEPALDLTLYGDRGGFMQNYLQQQSANLGTAFNEFGGMLRNALNTSYNFVTDQLVQMGLREELNRTGLNIVDNYYAPLFDYQALYDANLTMQRWIMANPSMRTLYLNDNVEGYADSYIDLNPSDGIGKDHYDYRRATNGVILDGPDDTWTLSHHFEDLLPGDRELTHSEKCDIILTWGAVDFILENGDFDFSARKEKKKINR